MMGRTGIMMQRQQTLSDNAWKILYQQNVQFGQWASAIEKGGSVQIPRSLFLTYLQELQKIEKATWMKRKEGRWGREFDNQRKARFFTIATTLLLYKEAASQKLTSFSISVKTLAEKLNDFEDMNAGKTTRALETGIRLGAADLNISRDGNETFVSLNLGPITLFDF